ncbi:MAG: hypothetical protein KKH98_09940 [Spirochaetes bacterium]|nr:hypothetical protein [Spirochaetota bacterium]
MKKIFIIIFILTLLSTGYSAFKEIQQAGPRAIGLGNAFTGLADDINTLVINPAGLMNIEQLTASISGGLLYPGLEHDNGIIKGNILSGMPLFTKGSFPSRLNAGIGMGFLYTQYYKENTFHLTVAHDLTKKLDLGVTAKLLMWSGQVVSVFDVTKAEYRSMNISMDAGLLYSITDNLSFGMALLDINRPDISSDSSSVADRLPTDYKFGLGYKENRLAADIDLSYTEEILIQNLGIEYHVLKNFIIARGGLTLFNLSSAGYQFNLGMSVDTRILARSFRFDYAFGLNGIRNSLGIHHAAILFSF